MSCVTQKGREPSAYVPAAGSKETGWPLTGCEGPEPTKYILAIIEFCLA